MGLITQEIRRYLKDNESIEYLLEVLHDDSYFKEIIAEYDKTSFLDDINILFFLVRTNEAHLLKTQHFLKYFKNEIKELLLDYLISLRSGGINMEIKSKEEALVFLHTFLTFEIFRISERVSSYEFAGFNSIFDVDCRISDNFRILSVAPLLFHPDEINDQLVHELVSERHYNRLKLKNINGVFDLSFVDKFILEKTKCGKQRIYNSAYVDYIIRKDSNIKNVDAIFNYYFLSNPIFEHFCNIAQYQIEKTHKDEMVLFSMKTSQSIYLPDQEQMISAKKEISNLKKEQNTLNKKLDDKSQTEKFRGAFIYDGNIELLCKLFYIVIDESNHFENPTTKKEALTQLFLFLFGKRERFPRSISMSESEIKLLIAVFSQIKITKQKTPRNRKLPALIDYQLNDLIDVLYFLTKNEGIITSRSSYLQAHKPSHFKYGNNLINELNSAIPNHSALIRK